MKRRGNRRYYQHHEVLLIRRIRELLYEQGFTISGARNRLADAGAHRANAQAEVVEHAEPVMPPRHDRRASDALTQHEVHAESPIAPLFTLSAAQVRQELLSIRGLLVP